MKNTIISCKSQNEYNDVLKKLEKMGYKWLSGNKPTEKTKYYESGSNILFVADDTITTASCIYPDDDCIGYERISADDFIGNKPIVIYRVGRTVVAYDQGTDKSATAKCHPDDEFDFYTGAKLAFSRLTGCDSAKPNNKAECDIAHDANTAKFKVGDTVRVKSGLVVGNKYHGSICPITLIDDMKTNEPLTIQFISPAGNYRCDNGYYYSPDMLEPYIKHDKFNIGDKVALKLNLVVGDTYNALHFEKYMACFGDTLTITKITHYNTFPPDYTCDNGYTYSEDMLEYIDDAIVIGSKIKVVDNGLCYDRYWQWVDENVKEQSDKTRYAFSSRPSNNDFGKVIAIAPHQYVKGRNLIYFKRHDGACYLMESDGVEKCDE